MDTPDAMRPAGVRQKIVMMSLLAKKRTHISSIVQEIGREVYGSSLRKTFFDTPAMPGMLRKSTAFVPRYRKFESISLQRRVERTSVREPEVSGWVSFASTRIQPIGLGSARPPVGRRRCHGQQRRPQPTHRRLSGLGGSLRPQSSAVAENAVAQQ